MVRPCTASITGLKVTSISTLQDENGPAHHTDDYRTEALIVRRGCSFDLDILHEGFDEETDTFYLELKTGKTPKKRDGSLIEIHNRATSKDGYSFKIGSKSDNSFRVSVTLPANTLVSSYTLSVISYLRKHHKKLREEFECPQSVYVLFNPWCEDDEVYMEDENLKEEYVLNDSGWVFTSGQRPKPWYFGQFTKPALECTFKLLETVPPHKRDNAREVGRHMSARCNSCDNDGLLVGNWSGDYEGGVKPWVWNGSVAIFRKYLEIGEPVEYGQCWVFSGLTTSMMRCLGIPARSVTNYDSAHDTDNNCTFDKYLDKDYMYLEDESDDSCWNFHVWNDVWMARPDLPAGMGGWQAIDGTPQEESNGVYQCGPASLQAIKEGEVNTKFDTPFVFAEVNADTVYWKQTGDKDKPWTPVRVKTDTVGSAILTKAPDGYFPSNIVNQYKHKEGSLLEEAAVRKALRKVGNPLVQEMATDIKFSSKIPFNVSSEDPINVKVNAVNDTSKSFSIKTNVTAQVVRYNGVKIKSLKIQAKEEEVGANSTASLEFKFDASEYVEHLDENISIRFAMVSKVKENSQVYVSQKICNVHKSELKLEAVGDVVTVNGGDEVKVKITIPSIYGLDRYSDCSLEVDCPIVDNIKLDLGDEAADGSAVIEKTFKVENVKKSKTYELAATFNSKEISGIHGTLKLNVTAK